MASVRRLGSSLWPEENSKARRTYKRWGIPQEAFGIDVMGPAGGGTSRNVKSFAILGRRGAKGLRAIVVPDDPSHDDGDVVAAAIV